MPTAPRFVELPTTTIVGLKVVAPFAKLFSAVPKAWREVFARSDELAERLDDGFVDCSLGAEDGVYTEIVGARMPQHSRAPSGFEAVTLPAARYATLKHQGDLRDIAESFGRLEQWIVSKTMTEEGERWLHDGVKLDVGYLPNGSETLPGGAGHTLYARVGLG